MKHKKNWPIRAVTSAVMVTALIGIALAAGQQGSQNDPLVTLSYLEKKVTPSIMEQVDQKVQQGQNELQKQLQSVADSYVSEVDAKLNAAGSGTSASFKVVSLKAGQKLTGKGGCEILLRSGTAVCVSDSAPGLVDMTGGGTLANGGVLTTNHLYLGTIDGRGVLATTAVTLMVRGNYTVHS